MSRFLCWSVVALLAATLLTATRLAVSQVPNEDPFAETPETPVSVVAVPAVPLLPAPDVGPLDAPAAQAPASQVAPAALSFPVVSSLDAAMYQKIEAALDATAEVDFQETPLSEVAAFLRETYKIPIIIDKRALDDVGLGSDTPVTISLRGISLRSLLRLMLRELDLTYVVRDQVLKITTPEEAENELIKRVYAVADLAPERRPPLVVGTPSQRYDTIVEVFTSIVAPNTWDEVGGAGSIEVFEPWGILAVSQTSENHEALESLLAAMRKAQRLTVNANTEADYAPVAAVQEAQTAAHAKIEQALDAVTKLDFSETPLQEVVQFLTDTYGIPVLIDRRALDDVGLGSDTPVTISLEGVSLRAALRLLVRDLDLTYLVADEVLKITTPEEAEKELKTMVYPVPDFLASPPEPGSTPKHGVDFDSLFDLLESTIEPDSWDAVGGAGVLEAVEPWGLLVISQTEEVQEEISSLLQVARRAHQVAPAAANAAPTVMPMGTMGAMGAMGTMSPGGQPLVLKLYAVHDFDIEQVIKAIQGTVAPETWGPGPSQGAIFPVGSRMLIRQTPAAHAEIEELLDALRAANGV